MYENIFVLIGPINETVTVLDVKPFNFAFDSCSQNFLFDFFSGRFFRIVRGWFFFFGLFFSHIF
jgi:hypothetical protein